MDGIDYRYTYILSQYTIFNKMENSTIVLPKSSRLNNLEYILARSTSNRMVLPRHQHLKMLNGKTVSQKTNSKVSSNHHHQNGSPFCDLKTNWKWKHVKKFKHSENTVTIRLFLGRITIANIHFTYLEEQCSKNCSMHRGLKMEKYGLVKVVLVSITLNYLIKQTEELSAS